MSATPALIAAAGGVGLGHAVLPDHWVPLAVLGRTHRYPLRRVARLSALAGVAHVLVSLLLGAIVIAVGLSFRSTVQSAEDTIIGVVLILTGVAFVALERGGHGHGHEHPHSSRDSAPQVVAEGSRTRGLAAIMVPFGAAASPDLTILPVFLAASAAGVAAAIGALVVFAVVTIATIVALTLLACFGGYQVHGEWLDRWGNIFTALVLVIIGVLVLASII